METRLGDAKRRILERLKRSDAATASELADELEVTHEAVRQHLDVLCDHGLVESHPVARAGARGRPPRRWRLTSLGHRLFPDHHADLTVSLISAIRSSAGEEGLDRVIRMRTSQQLSAYRKVVPRPEDGALRDRVEALARQRTAEGYMAEVVEDGDTLLLVEHHCPICDAAEACQGFCRGELELFRRVLGKGVGVERTQHLLAGDERCVYRIRSGRN